jgi:hypothetical protein
VYLLVEDVTTSEQDSIRAEGLRSSFTAKFSYCRQAKNPLTTEPEILPGVTANGSLTRCIKRHHGELRRCLAFIEAPANITTTQHCPRFLEIGNRAYRKCRRSKSLITAHDRNEHDENLTGLGGQGYDIGRYSSTFRLAFPKFQRQLLVQRRAFQCASSSTTPTTFMKMNQRKRLE